MLTIFGSTTAKFCDRFHRRNFLKVGAMAAGGLSLVDLLRLESQGATSQPVGKSARPKSIINIYLPGGPSHMDTFDLKPEAPAEFRGQFNPIATNLVMPVTGAPNRGLPETAAREAGSIAASFFRDAGE